jgi:hypothetical protein
MADKVRSIYREPSSNTLASGGDGGGSGLEARVAKLESDIGHIRSDLTEVKADVREVRKHLREDFRILFGALIAATLGLAAIIAKGFGWI